MAVKIKSARSPDRVNSSGGGGGGGGGTLADSDFVILEKPRWQANILVYGHAGQGKTTLATMHAPHPVALINFDNRATHAVRKAAEIGRRIHYTYIPYSASDITKMDSAAAQRIGQEALDKTVKNFEIAVRESQRGNIRTICLDTGTEYSEIITIAIRGTLGKANDYGRSKDLINRAWWHMFNKAREGNAHLIILARDKQIWVNNEPTDRFTFRGPEVMEDGVDWAGQIRLKTTKVGKVKKKVGEFELEITKAGINIEELGNVYTAELWDEMGGPFVTACVLQYEGSEPSDWE